MYVIGFYGAQRENGFMSNWYKVNFELNGIVYSSMEQYMMYQKAVCFKDEEIAREILDTDDVAKIKKLGRLVSNYNENHWNGIRQIVVYEGLKAKFSQNEELKKKLKATKDALLAECNPYDRIWGIGISKDHPNFKNPDKWRGKNLLGYALMMVREQL